jgi:hypothetical protein
MDYFVDWLTRLFEKIGTWAEEKEKKNREK